jgi:VanZ like family
MQPLAVITPVRLIPAIGMMTAIFMASSQPGDQLILPEFLNYDKVWHLLEYGLLTAACLYAFHPLSGRAKTITALGVILFSTLYGLSDELHQSFVPLRCASMADVFADFLGSSLVGGLWWRYTRR